MKLSDPFGRMERRHKAGYEAMRNAMQKGGIKTPHAAREVINISRQRGLKILCGGCVLFSLMGLIFPKTTPLAFGMAVFLIVWVITSTINGHRYIKRYIEEELNHLKSSEE